MKSLFKRFLVFCPPSLKNSRGIALLIVLSSLMILTIAIVEFSYTCRINYRLAVNAKERLQAYYLAKSALNFSRIILKYNKDAEKLAQDNADKLGDMKLQPLYRMMPLSSELIRGILGGAITEIGGEESGDEEPAAADGDEKEKPSLTPDVSMINKEEAEKFLSFEGDFSAEISEEQTKFDLNKIYGVETSSATYDNRKRLLLSLLSMPQFKEIFESEPQGAANLVHALSDWVDQNGIINEFDKVQRGSEDSIYKDDIKVKNSKFLTLSEMRLVEGVNDDIYKLLAPLVTVYSGSDKINVCLDPDEEIVKALVYHYTRYAGCTSSLDYEDEKLKELVTDVMGACPDVAAMSQAVDSKLGLTDLQAEASEDKSSTTDKSSQPTPESSPAKGGCLFKLSDFLTADNKVFKIKAVGTVGDTSVRLTSVVALDGKSASQWKYYYFRLE